MHWKTKIPTTLILAAILLSGCTGGDPPPDPGTGSGESDTPSPTQEGEVAPGGEGPVLVRRVENRTESGSSQYTAIVVVPDMMSNRANVQRFDLKRPEHLVEARFVLSWSSKTQDVADEVAFFIEQGSVIKEAYGPDLLELTVTGKEWTNREATVWIHPYWRSDVQAGAQVDLEWEVQITLVEEVPVIEDPDDEENDGSRGSNRPFAPS